jgi:hypothetical protein
MAIVSAKFELEASFVMAQVKGSSSLVKANYQGVSGLLYVVHCGQLVEELAHKANWIISCYLPIRWLHKSPFGLVNTVSTVKLYKENSTSPVFYIENSASQQWAALTQVPEGVEDDNYYVFSGEIMEVFTTLKNRGMSTITAIFGIANNLPDRWLIFQGYIVYTLYFYGSLTDDFPEDWEEIRQIQI